MKTFKQTWMWPSGSVWEWFLAFSCTIYGFSTCNPIRLRPIATCNMVIWFDFLTGSQKAAASCTHARTHTHSHTLSHTCQCAYLFVYQCVYTVNGAEQMLLEHCVIGTCKKLEQIIRSIDSIFGKCPPQVPSIYMSYVYISFDLSINLSFWIYLYMHTYAHYVCNNFVNVVIDFHSISESVFFEKNCVLSHRVNHLSIGVTQCPASGHMNFDFVRCGCPEVVELL